MSVNNINLAMAASYGAYSQKLTQATKAELEKLGIPYTPDMTEQQGRALIAQHKSQKVHNEGSNFNNEKQQKDNSLLTKAKNLANRLGISYDENIQLKPLLMLIEQTLENRINASQNNEKLLEELKGFSEELASIQAESMGTSFDTTNQALQMSLEMLSLYNKNMIMN